jgi:hypothetical protein
MKAMLLLIPLLVSSCSYIIMGQTDVYFTEPQITCTPDSFGYFYKSRPVMVGDPEFWVQRVEWEENGKKKYLVEILEPGRLDHHDYATIRGVSGTIKFEWGVGYIKGVCSTLKSCYLNTLNQKYGVISDWTESKEVYDKVVFEKVHKWVARYDSGECTMEISKK